jgi:hypothetical protein
MSIARSSAIWAAPTKRGENTYSTESDCEVAGSLAILKNRNSILHFGDAE